MPRICKGTRIDRAMFCSVIFSISASCPSTALVSIECAFRPAVRIGVRPAFASGLLVPPAPQLQRLLALHHQVGFQQETRPGLVQIECDLLVQRRAPTSRSRGRRKGSGSRLSADAAACATGHADIARRHRQREVQASLDDLVTGEGIEYRAVLGNLCPTVPHQWSSIISARALRTATAKDLPRS